MDSWQLKRNLSGQYKTVSELETLKRGASAGLEQALDVIGQDGVEALTAKRASEPGGLGPRKHEYFEAELAYEKALSLVEAYDELIAERKSLDALLVDPEGFDGFIDVDATNSREKRYAPISQRLVLKEPYADFFKKLKKLREKMGREDIGADDARDQAVQLAKIAGFKEGVFAPEALSIVMGLVKEGVDLLDIYTKLARDEDDRHDLDRHIEAFYVPIRNGLKLKPVEPVCIQFDQAVKHGMEGVAAPMMKAALDQPSPTSRPADVQAFMALAQRAGNSDILREAFKAFLKEEGEGLREEGNLVIDYAEPSGAGGS